MSRFPVSVQFSGCAVPIESPSSSMFVPLAPMRAMGSRSLRTFTTATLTTAVRRTTTVRTNHTLLHRRPLSTTTPSMSFSNANTGSQAADPYKQKNQEDPPLKEKVEALTAFMDKCKFCMMTTRTADGALASRCMALAAKVLLPSPLLETSLLTDDNYRKATVSTSSSTPTPNPVKPTTSRPTRRSTWAF